MPERQTVTAAARMRLDQLLVERWPVLDRKTVRQMIRGHAVWVNERPAIKAGQYIALGDKVDVLLPEFEPDQAPPSYVSLALKVVYEDDVLLVADKPAGMAMRTSSKFPGVAVIQQLTELYPGIAHIGGVERAGIVMRVDTEVSGLVLAAKTEEVYRALHRLVKRQRVQRVYSALVDGYLRGEHMIDEPVGNVKRARERLSVAREGRPARTYCRMQRHYKEGDHDYSLLDVRPETSRLHQIRVHLSWYGFPIVGDRVYGMRHQPVLPDRIFLHLSVLTFPHPVTGEEVRVESPLPPELYSVLRYMARPK